MIWRDFRLECVPLSPKPVSCGVATASAVVKAVADGGLEIECAATASC